MTAPLPTDPSLGTLFADLLRLLRRDFYARSEGLGLTPALTRLMLYIHRAPGSRQTDLATRLEVSPVTIGRMVDRLVACGYVRREADADDRRAFRIHIAADGVPLVERLNEISEATRRRAVEGLGPERVALLFSILGEIKENLDEGSEAP
jgi:DNA-binding MarR family transcriptional regulator